MHIFCSQFVKNVSSFRFTSQNMQSKLNYATLFLCILPQFEVLLSCYSVSGCCCSVTSYWAFNLRLNISLCSKPKIKRTQFKYSSVTGQQCHDSCRFILVAQLHACISHLSVLPIFTIQSGTATASYLSSPHLTTINFLMSWFPHFTTFYFEVCPIHVSQLVVVGFHEK